MRKNIDWVICAAGEGERFSNLGLKTPKPLLKLMGYTMLERSLFSLDIIKGDQLIIITQKKHKVKKHLSSKIKNLFPWVKIIWVELAYLTTGQLSTVLTAKKYFNPKSAIAIFNCDTFFKANTLNSMLSDKSIDAIVPCGKFKGTSWSFFKIDRNFNLIKATEKIKISPWASVGLYYFKNQSLFLKIANRCLCSPLPPGFLEYYVSILYGEYLKKNSVIKICSVELFLPFGTMEQVTEYWDINRRQFIKDNS